jgi:hypothetical protein
MVEYSSNFGPAIVACGRNNEGWKRYGRWKQDGIMKIMSYFI